MQKVVTCRGVLVFGILSSNRPIRPANSTQPCNTIPLTTYVFAQLEQMSTLGLVARFEEKIPKISTPQDFVANSIITGVCSFSGFCLQTVQQLCKFYPTVQNFNIVTYVCVRLEQTSTFGLVARIEGKILKTSTPLVLLFLLFFSGHPPISH